MSALPDDRPLEIKLMHEALLKAGYRAAFSFDEDEKGGLARHCFIAPNGETLALTDYRQAVKDAHTHLIRQQRLSRLDSLKVEYLTADSLSKREAIQDKIMQFVLEAE